MMARGLSSADEATSLMMNRQASSVNGKNGSVASVPRDSYKTSRIKPNASSERSGGRMSTRVRPMRSRNSGVNQSGTSAFGDPENDRTIERPDGQALKVVWRPVLIS